MRGTWAEFVFTFCTTLQQAAGVVGRLRSTMKLRAGAGVASATPLVQDSEEDSDDNMDASVTPSEPIEILKGENVPSASSKV